jgi:hypothetical protein
VGVIKATICAIFPFFYLNFTHRAIFASRGGIADEIGFHESNKLGFMCRGSEMGGQHILGQDCEATGRGGMVEGFVIVHCTIGHLTVM